MKVVITLLLCLFVGVANAVDSARSISTGVSPTLHALKVSTNQHFLVDSVTGKPVFLLADTAWNLGALKDEEIDLYLNSRAAHGFNVVMFALNFFPQAAEANAYGQTAYIGADKTELNPEYFKYCDAIVRKCAARGIYAMVLAMWAGEKTGTMNHYTSAQLEILGARLGEHFKEHANVILCVGGEASPHYVATNLPDALGRGLKTGCAGRNLITIHPVSGNSASKFYAGSTWLDFYMSQAKSSLDEASLAYDAAALVLRDFTFTPVRPTMMAEHRYETGTSEDPIIQRRSLYQCVFAGGCGHAYGHDALWQMTPHTQQEWMMKSWKPGVTNWQEALDAPGVRQLKFIKNLLASRPYLERMPDQSLVLAGQGTSTFMRIQAMRDGTSGKNDATYLMVYLSAPAAITLNTAAISSPRLNVSWFNPADGSSKVLRKNLKNTGTYTLKQQAMDTDGVLIVDDARRHYRQP